MDNGLSNSSIHTMESLQFGNSMAGSTVSGQLPVSNHGRGTNLNATNFVFSNAAFSFASPPDSVIGIDELANWAIEFAPDADFEDYNSTLTFNTNDPDNPTVTVDLLGNTFPLSLEPDPELELVEIFPNPFADEIMIKNPKSKKIEEIYLLNYLGQKAKEFTAKSKDIKLNTSNLKPGHYLLILRSEEGQRIKKMVLIR